MALEVWCEPGRGAVNGGEPWPESRGTKSHGLGEVRITSKNVTIKEPLLVVPSPFPINDDSEAEVDRRDAVSEGNSFRGPESVGGPRIHSLVEVRIPSKKKTQHKLTLPSVC